VAFDQAIFLCFKDGEYFRRVQNMASFSFIKVYGKRLLRESLIAVPLVCKQNEAAIRRCAGLIPMANFDPEPSS